MAREGTCLERVFFLARMGCLWFVLGGPQQHPCCFPVFFPVAGLRLRGTDETGERRHSLGNFFSFVKPQMIQVEAKEKKTTEGQNINLSINKWLFQGQNNITFN